MALATGGQIAVSAAHPAGKRRGPGRGRRGRRQARHGVEQRQSQYPGQRTARCAGQPGRQDTEQHRCLGGQAHADPDRQGRQRLRAGALVYAGRPAGSGRLSGHHRAWHRRMGVGGWHRHRGGRRAGESRRLPDQHLRRHAGRAERLYQAKLAARRGRPAVRNIASAGRSAVQGLVQGLRGCPCALGRQGHALFPQPADRAASALEEGYTAGRDAGQLVVSTKTAVLDGDIIGEAFQGVYQTQARQNIDAGVRQQRLPAIAVGPVVAGQLVIGGYLAKSFEQNGKVRWGYDLYATTGSISIQDGQPSGARQSTWTIPCRRLETAAFPWTPAG